MRNQCSLQAAFFALGLLSAAPAQAQSGGYSELRIIYVDNSRGEDGKGYSSGAQAYIRQTVQGLIADNGTNMLFYFSNGAATQYTRTQEKVMGMLEKLAGKPGASPDILAEKAALRNALYKGRLDLITRISLDLFVSDQTLQSELSGNRSGYLLNFFPRELQFMSKCNPSNITVRVHYAESAGASAAAADLNRQIRYCENCEGAALPVQYEFKPMRL